MSKFFRVTNFLYPTLNLVFLHIFCSEGLNYEENDKLN